MYHALLVHIYGGCHSSSLQLRLFHPEMSAHPTTDIESTGDGRCVICDSYVRPATLVRICDECNYGSYQGRCVGCGGPGVSDAYYCKECTIQEKDVCFAHSPHRLLGPCVVVVESIASCQMFLLARGVSALCRAHKGFSPITARRVSQDCQSRERENRLILRKEEVRVQEAVVGFACYFYRILHDCLPEL